MLVAFCTAGSHKMYIYALVLYFYLEAILKPSINSFVF